MTGLRDIYKCSICGHVVEIAGEGQPTLTCCNKLMDKLEAKTEDQGLEKHVPVFEDSAECNGHCIRVKVGSVEHPMQEDHYIKFIEVLTKDKVCRAELKPGQKPEAHFCLKKEDIVEVREYCTLHGLWKA